MKFKDPMCKAQFSFQLVLAALLLTAAQSGFAQTPPASPLTFENNFFVTGDYIVAGAYGMTTKFTTVKGVSYALGTINVPDTNPGITGATQVPVGAQIVAALLYWQTVEKVGVAPGANGSGQNGYFRPMMYSTSGGPAAPGYAMSGTSVSGSNTVSWSSGGCGGGSTGKVLRTYRADVSGGLPNDANGNPTPNGQFEIRIPSVGNSTPLTLGATLVVIYRIPSGAGGPQIPLNSIVIYDGDYSQSNTQLTMTQKLQGFYDADHNAVSRLTHIVGSGQSNKFQSVYLSSGTNSLVKLPLPYGNKLPAFPGWYGSWDNPTWTFNSPTTNPPNLPNPIAEDASTATTQILPSMSNQGCVSWGAIIMSTTVKNTDGDGILDSWKLANPSGYCDASLNNGVCRSGDSTDPGWVPLPGAMHGQKDVFLQYDYMCSTVSNGVCATGGTDYSFDPRLAVDTEDSSQHNAVDKVVAAYANHNINLHPISGNAILESQPNVVCLDTDKDASGNLTCPFPNEAGTVGFRYGLENIKNYSIATQTGRIGECTLGTTNCAPVFQPGKKDSYHYALFAHGVGVPNWFLFDQSLLSVAQKGNTVTFTTALPHGIKHIDGDKVCASGRVTVLFAVTNPNLNGTFCIKNVNAAGTTFDITVPGSPTSTTVTYPANAEPYLGVANGQVSSMSGFSDVGGQNVVVALGEGGWGPANVPTSDGNKWQTKAGTLMHELGHNMGLTHGGTFYNNYNPTATIPNYTPSFEANCKPNVQTSMSYMFQFDLMQVRGISNFVGKPLMVVDYSEDGSVPALTKNSPQGAGILTNLPYANTAAFQLPTNNSRAPHCDGSPLGPNEQSLTYAQFSPASDFFWSNTTGFDINFDGKTTEVLHPHNEWTGTPSESGVGLSPGIDLLQISAIGTLSTSGAGGGHLSGGGGGGHLSGGGGGGHLSGGGGGGHLSGGGGGGHLSGGGGAPSEFTHDAANSYARPPRSLTITEEKVSPRYIVLNWFDPTFGTVVTYNIYRTVVGTPFSTTPYASVHGTQTTYTDNTVTCNALGYQYRVTAVINTDAGAPQESVPTNTVPATGEPLLTGCYLVDPVNGLSNFTVPANAVHGSDVSISWTLVDDFFIVNPNDVWAHAAQNGVSKLSSGKLYVNGPVANGGNCTTTPATGHTLLATITNGVAVVQEPGDTLGSSGDVYTFIWKNVNTDNFCSGPYTFELDLDSGQKVNSTNALQLGIDINDLDGPRISNAPLTAGTVGVLYSNTFTQDGGVGTITWSIAQGSLPNGITLNPATGAISGYATTACTCTFTVQAKDSNGNIGTQAFTLVMHIWVSASPAPASAPFVANATLPPMTVGISTPDSTYQSGAVGAVTWSLAPGSNPLPTGITINNGPNTTGVLSGYATTACTCQFTIVATDSAGNTGTLTFTLVVHIFVSASQPPPPIQANFPFVPNPTLPAMTVGVSSSDTVYQSGAASGAVTWAFAGSLPPGVSQQGTGATISGTTCAAVSYNNISASVTDSANNTGSQALTLQVNKGTTTTGVTSDPNPSAFQQPVTFTVTVASYPQSSCVPTGGTVTLKDGGNPIAVNLSLNSSGVATYTTTALSVGSHSITASYTNDPNFNSSNSGVWSHNVTQAITQIGFNSLSSGTQFVGQPITVSYTFAVMAPGAGMPIPPSGNIVVSAIDTAMPPHTSSCMAAAYQGAGMCTLSPAPTVAGTYSYTISYPGDANFVQSGFNGNYNVYQLAFTTQPTNTGVGLAINPAVVVTAQDFSNNNQPLTTFTGPVTVAIGSGTGSATATLSGTLTQNAVGGVATFGNLSINKIANGYKLTAAPGGVPVATSNPFNIDTFYIDANGNFGTLDLPSGTVTQIGAATAANSNGIDLTPGGQVYAYNASNQLMQITPLTGAATPVGAPGSIPDQATTGALTNGSYFGIDAVTGTLYSIDTTAGTTMAIGPTSAAVLPAGCTLDSSLTGSGSVLYYTIGYSGTSCTSTMSDTLYQIDPTSGGTTTVGQVTVNGSGVNQFIGSAFVGGTLYGFTSGGQEYTIDTTATSTAGVATFVVNTTPTTSIIGAGSSE